MLKIPCSKKVASLDSHPGLSSLEHQPSHRRMLDAGVVFTSDLSTRCTMSALCDPASSGSPLEEAEPSTLEAPSQTSLHAAPLQLAEVSRSRFQPQLHALACETSDKLLTLSKGQFPLTIKMK